MKHVNASVACRLSAVACILFLISLTGCGREPQKTAALGPAADTEVVAETTILAAIADEHGSTSTDPILNNKPTFQVVFNEQGKGVAFVAKTGEAYHVVHNGKVGRPLTGVDQIRISPDGQRIAYSALVDGTWGMLIDEVRALDSGEVGDPVFSPDSKHIAYEVKSGGKWHIAVDDTMHEGCRSQTCNPIFSADSKKIAYVERVDDEGNLRLVVSDLAFKAQDIKENSGALIAANADRTRIAAVSTVNGGQRVLEFSFALPDDVTEGPVYDSIGDLVYGNDGISVAYVAERQGKRYMVLNGKEEPLDGGVPRWPLVVRPDNKGVGVIMASEGGSFLHEAFSKESKEQGRYDDAEGLIYSGDGSMHAYAARRGNDWFIVVNGREEPLFDRVVLPKFSPDGKRVVYRARKDGKRFVVVADIEGKARRQHPDYELVFQPVFTADGKSVAYGVKDGKKLIWKVEGL